MKKIWFVMCLVCTVLLVPAMVHAETVSGPAVSVPTPTPIPELQEPQVDENAKTVEGLSCKVSASLTSGTISWKMYEGAQNYMVYRKTGAEEYKLIKTLTETSFTDSNLKAGSIYTYKIQAAFGGPEKVALTPFSNEVTMKLIPSKIKGVKAKAHRGYNVLTWKKKGKGIAGYEVWGKVSIKIKGIKIKYHKMKTIKSRKKNSLKHKMLVKGMTYNYKIRCYQIVNKKKIYSDYVTIKKKAK